MQDWCQVLHRSQLKPVAYKHNQQKRWKRSKLIIMSLWMLINELHQTSLEAEILTIYMEVCTGLDGSLIVWSHTSVLPCILWFDWFYLKISFSQNMALIWLHIFAVLLPGYLWIRRANHIAFQVYCLPTLFGLVRWWSPYVRGPWGDNEKRICLIVQVCHPGKIFYAPSWRNGHLLKCDVLGLHFVFIFVNKTWFQTFYVEKKIPTGWSSITSERFKEWNFETHRLQKLEQRLLRPGLRWLPHRCTVPYLHKSLNESTEKCCPWISCWMMKFNHF